MTDFKSFKLPGNATLRIRTESIVATVSRAGGEKVDVYCKGVATPFHIEATKRSPSELIDYIWNIPTFESEDDI